MHLDCGPNGHLYLTPHAHQRYRERCGHGCRDPEAVARLLERRLAAAQQAAGFRGCRELQACGWVFVVERDTIITCYQSNCERRRGAKRYLPKHLRKRKVRHREVPEQAGPR